MIRAVTVRGHAEPTGGTLLLQVAIALREQRLRPRSLEWRSNDAGEVNLTLAVEVAEEAFARLLERLNEMTDVRSVEADDGGAKPRPAGRPGDAPEPHPFLD